MILNSELRHAFHPNRTHFGLAVINIIFLAAFFVGLYQVANHIKTQIVPTGTILLSTNYSKYVVGENIKYTLTNEYNSRIYITNQCPAEPLAVYQLSSTGWTRIHATAPASTCASQPPQVSIAPGGSITTSLASWQSLFSQPGLYRLVALINNSTNLPLVDFQVITTPAPVVQQKIVVQPQSSAPVSNNGTSSRENENTKSSPVTQNTQTIIPAPNAKTYTLNVDSRGNYSPTSLTLNVGDSITFIYTPPYSDEVNTQFTPIAPTTTSIRSVTVDSEFTSRTVTFNVRGTWSFRAEDHNGNTGRLTVN